MNSFNYFKTRSVKNKYSFLILWIFLYFSSINNNELRNNVSIENNHKKDFSNNSIIFENPTFNNNFLSNKNELFHYSPLDFDKIQIPYYLELINKENTSSILKINSKDSNLYRAIKNYNTNNLKNSSIDVIRKKSQQSTLINKKLQTLPKISINEKVSIDLDFMQMIINFLKMYSNIENLQKYLSNENKCGRDMDLYLEKNKTLGSIKFKELFMNTGKSVQDIGLEENCKMNNNAYYIIKFRSIENFWIGSNKEVIKFLNITNWVVGICFLSSCSEFIEDFVNPSINKKFFDLLLSNRIDDFIISEPKIDYELTNGFYYFFIVFISYLVFKFFCSFFVFFLKKDRKNTIIHKKEVNQERFSINNHEDDNNETNYDMSFEMDSNKKIFSAGEINYSNENDISQILIKKNYRNIIYERLQKYLSFFYNFFSYQTNFVNLMSKKNELYEDSGLEGIYFVRVLLLFLITFNHVFYTSILLPYSNHINKKNFTSFLFGFFKFSVFAIDCYVILEALIVIFKLMKYIKKKGPGFKTFLKFYTFCLPKVCLFFIVYFLFNIEFQNLGKFINPKGIFEKFLIDKYENKECYKTDSYNFLNFIDFSYGDSDPRKFTKCFRFVYIYVNGFLSFNIFLIIFYFSLKLKRRFFDTFIAFFFLGSLLSIFYYFFTTKFENGNSNEFNFFLILSEVISVKLLHLYLVRYFFGVLLGLFYFYISELTLNDSYVDGNNYMPFKTVYNYLVFLNIKRKDLHEKKYLIQKGIFKKRSFRRVALLISSLAIILLFSYYFSIKIWFNNQGKILIEFSTDLKLIYFFEKYIFCFAFIILISCIKVYTKKNFFFNAFTQSRIFVILERVMFVYICINDTIVYIFFTLYNIQFYFNYENIFLITIGLQIINLSISFLIVYLIELPIRKSIRIIRNRFY